MRAEGGRWVVWGLLTLLVHLLERRRDLARQRGRLAILIRYAELVRMPGHLLIERLHQLSLQGKRRVRVAGSLAWVVWGNCGGGTSRWSVFAARRKDPKLASAALRVPPNWSASRNMSVSAKGPSHLGTTCSMCSAYAVDVLHHCAACAVRCDMHQFVQSMEGSVTARIG